MSEITIVLPQEFLEAYARLPRRKQGKVMAMVTKFRENPYSPGLNYETLATPDPNLRSIRVDDDYRAIVLKPERGNVYVLLWVDKHDDAYAWASRHRVDIPPRTGSLQILASSTEEVPAEHAEPATDTSITASTEPLFQARDRELLRLGVPEMLLVRVKKLSSENALEALAPRLPEEAFEALTFLAQGEPLDEELSRIEVVNIDRLVTRLVNRRGAPRLVYPTDKGYRDAWKLAMQMKPVDPDLPKSFYEEEWQQVILPQHVLTRQDYFRASRAGRGVRLATLHRVKGLEFREMHIACVNEGVIPATHAGRTEDPVEKRHRELNERALLHVAATRAIKRLHVSSHGTPSDFLTT